MKKKIFNKSYVQIPLNCKKEDHYAKVYIEVVEIIKKTE